MSVRRKDCLQDLGDAVGAARHARQAFSPDGAVMLAEPYAGDNIEDSFYPVGRLYYAASAAIRTFNSLSQEVVRGLGTQADEARLREVMREAGFNRLRRTAETPFNTILKAGPQRPVSNRGDQTMSILKPINRLLVSIALATPVLVNGHEQIGTRAAQVGAPTDEPFQPAYLAAAVCGLHDHHGGHHDEAFARRAALIKLARARMPTPVEDKGPPLYDNLGDYSYPITTSSDRARRYFDQGLRLTYAFNHVEALRSFERAQELDPGCAMCYWGEAYVLGPNINAPMEPAAVKPAVEAIEQAKAQSSDENAREQALITALGQRYFAEPGADQSLLNEKYAKAMAKVAARYPDDVDIATLYADALMNLSPWDYWKTDRRTPKPAVAPVVDTLEGALAKAPKHPYAIHLYIHAVEASATPERAEVFADRLGEQVPGAGHMVHMPFHIYFRTGRFDDAIEVNRDAVAADEAYLAQAPVNDMYAYGYYPHNVHSLLESARMAGDGKTAIEAAEKLPKVMADEMAAVVPWVQLIKAAPYFTYAQFSDPNVTLSVPDPGDRFPYVKAMWHYARGVAQAADDKLKAARTEAAHIATLEENTDFSDLAAGGVPAPDLLRLARHVVDARIEQARGDYDAAVDEFAKAVDIQASLAYMEPPFWYYPVSQSLGATLLQAGRPAQAEAVFRQSLEQTPNNGWALYGLMRAQAAQGSAGAAAKTQQRLAATWADSGAELALAKL